MPEIPSELSVSNWHRNCQNRAGSAGLRSVQFGTHDAAFESSEAAPSNDEGNRRRADQDDVSRQDGSPVKSALVKQCLKRIVGNFVKTLL